MESRRQKDKDDDTSNVLLCPDVMTVKLKRKTFAVLVCNKLSTSTKV